MPTPRARAEWAARVRAEYRSAAQTAQVVHLLLVCGLDEGLARAGLGVVQDELDHARLSHEVLVALGGGEEQDALDAGELSRPSTAEGPLALLVDAGVGSLCLGETFAVPLFSAMRRGTTHPVARAALDRILRDEVRHRQLGWDLLDGLLELDPDGVRGRVTAALPGWLSGFRQAYRPPEGASPLTPQERAAGLLPAADYRQEHDRCVAEELQPRLGARGIPLPP